MKKNVITDPVYGYLRLNPIPTEEEVNEFYAKEFYDSNASYFNNSALDVQKEQSDFFNSRWDAIYENCKHKFGGNINDKKVFDIGFGFAQTLIYLKNKNLNVSGLEPSIEGVEYARSNGLEVFHTGIENFDCVGEENFDIVLLMNVLEHLRSPAETLLNIKEKLLTKDGVLVIDVPNDFNVFQDVANKEYDLNEWWVVSPNHINYFSATTLINLLKDCGYEIYDYEASFPLDMFLLFGDQYVGNSEVGKICHNKRVNFESLMRKHNKQKELKDLYRSFADLNLGRTITVYAVPKNK